MSGNRVFPTWMHHPHHADAVLSQPLPPQPGEPLRRDNPVKAIPEKFPPQLVHNEQDEDYYIAQGYVSQSNDPVGFARLSQPAKPTPAPQTVNGKPAAESVALVDPDGAYPRYVGNEIARDEEEEWEICQRTGIPFEGRGGSRHEPVSPPRPAAPEPAPSIPSADVSRETLAIDPNLWEEFQAFMRFKAAYEARAVDPYVVNPVREVGRQLREPRAKPQRKRQPRTAAQREAASKRMKAKWAERRQTKESTDG